MSRGFTSTLAGIAVTIFSWYGPWEWPAAPALALIHLTFGSDGNFAELAIGPKAAFFVLLIVVNATVWAAVTRVLIAIVERLRSRQSTRPPQRELTPTR